MADPVTHPLYDVLKDFQPTLAATIALVAAAIAFFGATSKTRFDKRVVRQLHEREKLGVYLRCRYEVELIGVLANGMIADADFDKDLSSDARPQLRQAELAFVKRLIEETPEIKAAWQKLEFFPIELSEKINLLRARLFVISIAFDPNLYPVYPARDAKRPVKITEIATELSEIALQIRDGLGTLIDRTELTVRSLS